MTTDGLRGVLRLAVVLGACIGCSEPTKPDCLTPPCPLPIAIVARVSSGRRARMTIVVTRFVGVMFMRVNAKCAHQLRPPLAEH